MSQPSDKQLMLELIQLVRELVTHTPSLAARVAECERRLDQIDAAWPPISEDDNEPA